MWCVLSGSKACRLLSTVWCTAWSNDRSRITVHVCATSWHPRTSYFVHSTNTYRRSAAASLRWPTGCFIQVNEALQVLCNQYFHLASQFSVFNFIMCRVCFEFPFSALRLLVGRQEGHPACKKLDVGLLMAMIWLEFCTTYSSSCHHHLHHPLLQ